MKKIILLIIILLMIASPVMAQSKNFYHEVTIELDGEWKLDQDFAAPEVTSTITLEGVGKALIKSITKAQTVPVWWELF